MAVKSPTQSKPRKAPSPPRARRSSKAAPEATPVLTPAQKLAASNAQRFGTRRLALAAQRHIPAEAPRRTHATTVRSLAGVLLGTVLGRRVVALLSRQSERGSFTRGEAFVVVGKCPRQGWTVCELDGQGQRTRRVCVGVPGLFLQPMEEHHGS